MIHEVCQFSIDFATVKEPWMQSLQRHQNHQSPLRINCIHSNLLIFTM